MEKAKHSELNDRAMHLLKVLVERYISDGQPVGSRVLSRDLSLSPATIRNVMADLEDLGLVCSPHTSAGRVPTVTGYRLFVDALLTVRPLKSEEIVRLKEGLVKLEDAHEVIGVASQILSDVTRMAGVVTLPKREIASFRHIEFLPLSNTRILVILVTNEQEVHNKIIQVSKEFNASELQKASNYLNSLFSGKNLLQVRDKILADLLLDKEKMNKEMQDAIEMARLTFQSESKSKDDYVISGETNLMDFSELSDKDNLRQLFEAFSQKRDIISLLDQCLKAEGVQIFIGDESGYQPLGHCSLVTSTYSVDNEVVGVLGVIGPTRMAYEKVIPFVDVTAKILGSALNQKTSTPS